MTNLARFESSMISLLSHLRIDKKRYPGDDYKQARGEVISHHIERHFPGQHDLEARHAVVHVEGGVLFVLSRERVDLYIVVQDGADGVLLGWSELVLED